MTEGFTERKKPLKRSEKCRLRKMLKKRGGKQWKEKHIPSARTIKKANGLNEPHTRWGISVPTANAKKK